MMPGPNAPKIPKLSATIRAGDGGLLTLLNVTYTETAPSGAFEGMMALICAALTNTGIALTVVLPCTIWMETPPSVVVRGNARFGLEDGPRRAPKMLNNEPRAIGAENAGWRAG